MHEALQLFSDDLLQDVAIECEIRHQLFQLAVFVPERSQLADVLETDAGELLLPAVETLLADAEPATDVGDFFAGFDLPEGGEDGFVAVAFA